MKDETPHQKLDYYVGHQVRGAREAGQDIDVELVARRTAGLLQQADQEMARGRTRASAAAKPKDVLGAKESIKAKAQADAIGGQVYAKQLPNVAAKVAAPATGVDLQRQMAMVARLQLLARRSSTERIKQGVGVDKAPHEYPKFAIRIAVETMAYSGRWGQYRDRSSADAHRIYIATMERICDESNGAVGFGWWVVR